MDGKNRFEIIGPNTVTENQIPKEKIVERPWGFYRMFAENIQCTAKILHIKSKEMLSLQFHKIRDQIYYIIDEDFQVWISDIEVPRIIANNLIELKIFAETHLIKYNCEPGSFIKIPKYTLHRPMYYGEKEYGRLLDMAFNKNDESDICRIEDVYGRV